MSNRPLNRLSAVALSLLVALTGIALLTNLPSGESLYNYGLQWVSFVGLTALALVFGVMINDGEFSAAHALGIMAFLTLPEAASDAMLLAMVMGGMLGGALLVVRGGLNIAGRRGRTKTLANISFVTARVALSFFVGSVVYIGLNGELPFNRVERSLLALLAYLLAYIAIYFAIYVLELYADGRPMQQFLHVNRWLLLSLLLLPLPFAMIGVEVAREAGIVRWLVFVLATALTIFGLYAYSRSEFRLRKQLDELRSLSVVTQAMRAHLNLDTLLKTIYLQVANLLDVENFLVALYDIDQKTLEFPFYIRQGIEERFSRSRASLDSVLLERVLRTRAPLLIPDDVFEQAKAMGLKPPFDVIQSWLGVPLLAGGNVLGAMVVSSREPRHHFTANDLRLLNIIAASASIAIENAQLYQRQTERSNRLATLNNINALLTGTLSPDTVLDTIISSASTIAQANAVAVYLYWDEAQTNLALARSAGMSDEFAEHPPDPLLMREKNGQPLSKQPPLVIHDISKEPRAQPLQALMVREKKAAWIELPLAVGEAGLGVLCVYFDDPQTPDGENVELLRTFATQAAQAISNARLYTSADEALERRVEQLFSLAAMGRLLTATMDMRQICEVVLGYASDATKAACGLVAMRDDKDELKVLAQRGFPDTVQQDPNLLLQGLTGRVLEDGHPSRIGNVRGEAGYLPMIPNTRSQLVVPILQGKDAIGVIRLESEKPEAFSEEDSYFVGQIANQTVIAVHNARLFQRITEARDRLQVLLDAMEEAIVLIDDSSHIVLANPRVDMIGLKPIDLIDHSIEILVKQPHLKIAERLGFASDDALRQLIQHLPSLPSWRAGEAVFFNVQTDKGSLYVQRQVIPVRDTKGSTIGALLVFYNKTEEQELARAREDLSQMIVHDLRSPLTAVTTSLKLLRELVPQDSDFKQIVDTTTDASARAIRKLLSRVDALLDISKMESGELTLDSEPTELATIADSVCVELSPLAHELDVDVVSQVPESLPLLNVDPDKLERVLLNLVDNALKYSPAETSVTIRAHLPGTMGAKEQFIRIDVVDSGPGVPDEYKQRLFDRFVQIEGRRKVRRGVGLGLTFCKLVVEAHGGKIWIEDNPSGGSIFAFTVPILRIPTLEKET
jgi:K+-sensing histidine kinase KdpD